MKKENRYSYRVPYDFAIYSETQPTKEDIENAKKICYGIVRLQMLECQIVGDAIDKDLVVEADYTYCPFAEGRVHAEFNFWCYYNTDGEIKVYKIKKRKEKK